MRHRPRHPQRPRVSSVSSRLREEDAALTDEAKTLLIAGLTVGAPVVVGGLSGHFLYHELVAAWGMFPILAGCMGGLELLNPFADSPTAQSVQAKRRWVQRGLALLMLSILAAVGGGLLLATA